MWQAKPGRINLFSLNCLELNIDFSYPSQGVLRSDGIWKVKSIPNGKDESCPHIQSVKPGRDLKMIMNKELKTLLNMITVAPQHYLRIQKRKSHLTCPLNDSNNGNHQIAHSESLNKLTNEESTEASLQGLGKGAYFLKWADTNTRLQRS